MNNEFIHGNLEEKYHTKNPFFALLMNKFIKSFHHLLDTHVKVDIRSVCEIGCGDGELLKILHKKFPSAQLYACDLSPEEILKAQKNCKGIDINFSIQDAHNLSEYNSAEFDLVICCEVLEHLNKPKLGLFELERITSQYLLFSVPNEPIWRILNLLRCKYIESLGNTPGHINHWNKRSLNKFISQAKDLKMISNTFPFPWQMKMIRKVTPKVLNNKN